MVAIHTRDWETNRAKLALAQSRGRRSGAVAGGWVSDLASLGKSITLCGSCRSRFDAKRSGYEAASRPPFDRGVVGECDGCRQTTSCTLFNPAGRF